MLLVRKPSAEAISNFLHSQTAQQLTYASIGATNHYPPAGYTVDHTRVQLGRGRQLFDCACGALRRWDEFRLGWLEALPADTPLEPGRVVAVVAHALGFWWLNACRIVYVVDDADVTARFGFAYGTLPEHVGRGEERFLVEWCSADDSVWYDILAFSRPQHPLAWLAYPVFRRSQRQFARASARAMLSAVARAAAATGS